MAASTSATLANPRMRERKFRRIRPTLVFGCTALNGRCLSGELPEFSHKSDLAEHGFGCGGCLGLPMLAQAVSVPELGEFPSLREGQRSPAWPLPLPAPAIDVLFRPEQEHGASGKCDVLIPFAGGYGDMDDAARGKQFARTNLDRHGEIAAAAGSLDAGILAEHGGIAERVPDAIAEPETLADGYGKRS